MATVRDASLLGWAWKCLRIAARHLLSANTLLDCFAAFVMTGHVGADRQAKLGPRSLRGSQKCKARNRWSANQRYIGEECCDSSKRRQGQGDDRQTSTLRSSLYYRLGAAAVAGSNRQCRRRQTVEQFRHRGMTRRWKTASSRAAVTVADSNYRNFTNSSVGNAPPSIATFRFAISLIWSLTACLKSKAIGYFRAPDEAGTRQ